MSTEWQSRRYNFSWSNPFYPVFFIGSFRMCAQCLPRKRSSSTGGNFSSRPRSPGPQHRRWTCWWHWSVAESWARQSKAGLLKMSLMGYVASKYSIAGSKVFIWCIVELSEISDECRFENGVNWGVTYTFMESYIPGEWSPERFCCCPLQLRAGKSLSL